MIIEYMLVRESGVKLAPSWVENGGYFQNPDDFTLVGWTPDEGKRDYYVPDTVVVLTRESLIARQLAIHAKYPMTDVEGTQLTNEQVIAVINTWCDSVEQ